MDIRPRRSIRAKRQTNGRHRRYGEPDLHILPDNLLLAGIFIAACFISLSIGTSVGTIVALTRWRWDWQRNRHRPTYMVAVVVGGSFFGDNLSFISDTTIASTKTQDCVMRDKFKVNFMIVVPAALIVLGIYIFQGLSLSAAPQMQTIEWIKVIPYLIVLGTAVSGMNVMLVLLLGIFSTGIIGICTATGVFGATPAESMNVGTAFFDWFGAMERASPAWANLSSSLYWQAECWKQSATTVE